MTGNVAECGVFNGDFSIYINKYFYDKKLYLFDTFSGFDENDHDFGISLGEKNFQNGIFANPDIFGDIIVESVVRRMSFPDNCIIKQGYFP